MTGADDADELIDRSRAELELLLSQKLEAVGQLAAGIAHEINTPVQFVGDTLRFLREAHDDVWRVVEACEALVDSDDCSREAALAGAREAIRRADLPYLRERLPAAFDRADDGVQRVARIVDAIREFAHPPTTAKGPVDLNQALRNTLLVAANEYKYVADIEWELGDLPPVTANAGDLNQVFLNLVINAAHAISDAVTERGGRGTITIGSAVDGDDVVLVIADTGMGIGADVGPRIFEPFFTTKDVGRGTGQGLAISRTIVHDRHGGTLTFQSRVGEGTSFRVRLPIHGGSGADDDDGSGAAGPDLAGG